VTLPSAAEITKELVRFPSITPDETGAQDYLKSLLKPMGFQIFDLPFDGNGSYPVKNFFARLGKAGPHLCFAGHTDVVPPGDEKAWSVPPFSGGMRGDSIIGRGTSDMKGNIAAFVTAVGAFIKEKWDFRGSIGLIITGDEEKDSINGTKRVIEWMKENEHLPDVCLVGEPSNPDFVGQEVKIGRRGSLSAVLTVNGKQGHVAYPDRAHNPLPVLVHCLEALTNTILDKGSAFFPSSNLEITSIDVGNKAGNIIPASGKARFNVRFSDRWTFEALENRIRTIIDSITRDYKIEFTRGAESFFTRPGEWTAIVCEAVEKATGYKPAQTANGGTSDARFIAPYCPVVEFGLVNQTIHQVDEYCTKSQLELCEKIYLEILKLYFR
jgi:succinyl-diaminopimelate desuccinylase